MVQPYNYSISGSTIQLQHYGSTIQLQHFWFNHILVQPKPYLMFNYKTAIYDDDDDDQIFTSIDFYYRLVEPYTIRKHECSNAIFTSYQSISLDLTAI
jgi:hypothetical protein